MKKIETISRIKNNGLVAVIRANSEEEAIKIVDACVKGGITIIELTFTTPKAHKVIEKLDDLYGNEILLGAGTVLDPETARLAILSGSKFIVTPHLDSEIIKLCNRYSVPCMPGCMTIKDVVSALELGCDIIKLFPGDIMTPNMIKDIKGPIPNANIMPTGGVSVENLKDWFKAGAIAVGTGSSLTKGAKTNDFSAITKEAERFVEEFKKVKEIK